MSEDKKKGQEMGFSLDLTLLAPMTKESDQGVYEQPKRLLYIQQRSWSLTRTLLLNVVM